MQVITIVDIFQKYHPHEIIIDKELTPNEKNELDSLIQQSLIEKADFEKTIACIHNALKKMDYEPVETHKLTYMI